ncbi:MAG TPA: hypothetical protein VGR00_06905, partial [Thermoanaerobaculia bacterium]|nr:hypothetical protein [Thermoanaerobaculia bacterium]
PWGKCYGAELSGDGWDGLGGEEKLFEFVDGDDLGYPCCINKNVPNPSINPKPDCSKIGATVLPFTLHDTPFGFDWEKGKWPEPYRGALFVGLHGVFFSWVHTGLEWTPTDPVTHRPLRMTAPFLTGFGRNAPINGRVGDTLFAPDGRLFIADDQGGAIYWIAPKGLRVPSR